jgi:hypothetical protein
VGQRRIRRSVVGEGGYSDADYLRQDRGKGAEPPEWDREELPERSRGGATGVSAAWGAAAGVRVRAVWAAAAGVRRCGRRLHEVNPREKERENEGVVAYRVGVWGCEPRSKAVVCFFTFDTEKIYGLAANGTQMSAREDEKCNV